MNEFKSKKIWKNGQIVDWDDATVHVLSHALHYGSSWFEGIRCYGTRRGAEVFRLDEHVNRLFDSCKIYRTAIPYSKAALREAILETIRVNELKVCYVRPIVLRGTGAVGVSFLKASVEAFVIAWEWGSYLGEDGLEKGVDVCVSSWNRAAPNTFPTLSKAGGNYLNSALVKMEAELRGYSEGIALDTQGLVSEGSGENLFLVQDGAIYTPPVSHAILPGITRSSVITLAEELGLKIVHRTIPREMLYVADELFFTGTAAEVTPIRSVDDIEVGEGRRGPITARIQEAFFEIVEGRSEDRHNWLTAVYN